MTNRSLNWPQMAWIGNAIYWILLACWLSTSSQPSDSIYEVSCVLISLSAGFIILNPWQSNPFDPLKLVAFLYGTSFGLGPLLLAPAGIYRIPYLGGSWERLLSEGAYLALMGWLALLGGYCLYGAFRKRIPDLSVRIELSRAERSTIIMGGVGLFFLGGIAYAGLVYEAGGMAHFLLYTGGRADIFNGVFGGLYWGSFFLLSGLSAVGSVCARKHPLLVILLAITIGILFVPFQGREEVIAPLICGLFLVHYGNRRISMKWLVLAAVAIFIMASFLAYFRNVEKTAVYRSADTFVTSYADRFAPSLQKTLAQNIEQMDAFLIAMRYVEQSHKTLDGRTLLNWLEPLNRHFWSGVISTEHPGKFLTILVNPEHRWSQTALSPSVLGELYLNFAVPGIVTGMFLYGLVLRWLSEGIYSAEYCQATLMLYPYTIWIISKIVVDGSVHLFRPVVVAVPTLVLYWLVSGYSRSRREIGQEADSLVG